MAARFFCDNCGTEVKRNSNRCPKCRRFFVFVRCPQCGFTGEESNFAGGCPACGYCTNEQKKITPAGPPVRRTGKLPLWVYVIALLALALVALVLYLTVA